MFPNYWVYFKVQIYSFFIYYFNTFPNYWVYFKVCKFQVTVCYTGNSFQTIESILKFSYLKSLMGEFSGFQTIESILKFVSWLIGWSRYDGFQTIESILKYFTRTWKKQGWISRFQTIESILKLRKIKHIKTLIELFPNYWVYFKVSDVKEGVYEMIQFPNYWVYFKVEFSIFVGIENSHVSKLLSLF